MSLKTDGNRLLADIHPGVSIGPFRKSRENKHESASLTVLGLGASLYSVLQLIRANSRVFQSSHISFSIQNPMIIPIIVELPSNGIRLQFDAKRQYLRLIEILEWGKAKFIYKNTELGRQTPINFRYVFNKVFGPTYPGQQARDNVYVLSYPGISFSFPIPSDIGTEHQTSENLIKYLSQPSSSLCNSMAIYRGKSWTDAVDKLFDDDKLSPATNMLPHEKNSLIEVDQVYCHIDDNGDTSLIEISFYTHPDMSGPFPVHLNETTMQEIIVALGPPDERLQKHDSRLLIHSPNDQKSNRTDVLFNYFRHGMDFCFDTSFGMPRVNKIILHNNLPRTLQFQKYKRCRWSLKGSNFDSSFTSFCSAFDLSSSNAILINGEMESPSSSMELVGNGDTIAGMADDWGQTALHAIDNIVLEVLTANDMISTITFFAKDSADEC